MLKFFKRTFNEAKDELQNWNKTRPLLFFQFFEKLCRKAENIGNTEFHFGVTVQNQLTLLDG